MTLAVIATAFLAILICWIDQSRKLAQQQQWSNTLRKFGMLQEDQFEVPVTRLPSPSSSFPLIAQRLSAIRISQFALLADERGHTI